MSPPPATPTSATAAVSFDFAQSLCRKKPHASPAKANAVHGNIGKSHACGTPRLWQPSMNVSSSHGRKVGRHVVQMSGVNIAIPSATAPEATVPRLRSALTSDVELE